VFDGIGMSSKADQDCSSVIKEVSVKYDESKDYLYESFIDVENVKYYHHYIEL
jgi:hypothetical protein